MLRKIALRSSEDLVVVGPLKHLARINEAPLIEDVAAILLHSDSYSSRAPLNTRRMSRKIGASASPKWGKLMPADSGQSAPVSTRPQRHSAQLQRSPDRR